MYSYVHIFARKDGPVSTVRDLKGKAVGVGAAGSGCELTARAILEHYGLTYADINPQFIRETEAAGALKDRRVHAFFATHPLGSSVFADLADSVRIRMLSVDDPAFYEANPWFDRYEILSGVYEGVEGPIVVPVSRVVMLSSVNSGLTEDDAYRILSAIWDNRDEWKDVHAAVRSEITFEAALSGISVTPPSRRRQVLPGTRRPDRFFAVPARDRGGSMTGTGNLRAGCDAEFSFARRFGNPRARAGGETREETVTCR